MELQLSQQQEGGSIKMTTAEVNVQSETSYVSVGVGRHANNISCCNAFLLYSQSKCPILYDLNTNSVAAFLIGHKSQVNGQEFVVSENMGKCTHIISTSYDNSAIIWQINLDENRVPSSQILYSFKSPSNDEFISRCSFQSEENKFISITTSLNGSIYLWVNDELEQTIATHYCSFYLKLYTIPVPNESGPPLRLLFFAGSDNIIHIFQIVEDVNDCFSLKMILEISGHTDWIRCLDVLEIPPEEEKHEFLLASAAQDAYVRVWLMKIIDHEIVSAQNKIRTKVSLPLLASSNLRLTANLETVLAGHSSIAYGVRFIKRSLSQKQVYLISCSGDKTLALWQTNLVQVTKHNNLDSADRTSTWKLAQRLGETGETNLPFLGLCLSEDESTVYSHSLRGAIHSWRLEDWQYKLGPTITGHSEPVTDLAWEKSGAYLLSCSLDKTCRMHAVAASDNKWHEISRPQAHGHEINCLTSINFTTFVTGAEEKIIRVFEATQFFLKNYKTLTKRDLPKGVEENLDEYPAHAQLPALGLSNRGAEHPYDIEEIKNEASGGAQPNSTWYLVSKLVEKLTEIDHLETLPSEEILVQYTLWWESKKLFRHGHEMHALAVNSKGTCMASSSRANKAEVANIILWNCASNFTRPTKICCHSLTVTRLRFSPNDRYLLSVSRDRSWYISEASNEKFVTYEGLIGTTKTNSMHNRIIWDCCWTHDSKYFMTVSRDKKAVLWPMDEIKEVAKQQSESTQEQVIKFASSKMFENSIQAVDSPIFGVASDSSYLFALGFEDGSLELHKLTQVQNETQEWHWQLLKSCANHHHLPIRRLAFKPTCCFQEKENSSDREEILLASGGDDCVLRLTKFVLG